MDKENKVKRRKKLIKMVFLNMSCSFESCLVPINLMKAYVKHKFISD